jgi:hypothetical protein
MSSLLLLGREARRQVVEYFAGQPQSAPGGQGPGQVLVNEALILLVLLLAAFDAGDHGLAHLLHKLREKERFGLHGHLGDLPGGHLGRTGQKRADAGHTRGAEAQACFGTHGEVLLRVR